MSKVWFITGAGSGIGAATARAALKAGDRVVATGRNLDKVRNALRDVAEENLALVRLDVANEVHAKPAVDAAVKAFGRIDVLVNNAGESSQRAVDGVNWPVNAVDSPGQRLPAGRFEKITDEEWREALEQKVLGMIRVTRAALPWMRKAGGGSIVNITSIKGRQPPPRVVTSGVAWAAAMNFSKGLSLELAGEGIRVNVVSVGGILTGQMESGRQKWAPEKTLEEFLAPRVANIPLKRLGSIEEVAQSILFLASPQSSYITGQCLCVDGGGVRMA